MHSSILFFPSEGEMFLILRKMMETLGNSVGDVSFNELKECVIRLE